MKKHFQNISKNKQHFSRLYTNLYTNAVKLPVLLPVFIGIITLTNCASIKKNATYVTPQSIQIKSGTTAQSPLTEAWQRSLIQLTKGIFFIENSEREAGIINISFDQTDPGQYVTCGNFTIKDRRLSGTRNVTYDPVSSIRFGKGFKTNGEKVTVIRSTQLYGKANLLFLERDTERTRVRVNILYTLVSKTQFKTGEEITDAINQSYSFTTANRFEGIDDVNNTKIICQTKGTLEKALLNTARRSTDLDEDEEEDI
ncbi:hypothetical protein COTS27_00156 [Spirochaetota bacterium]|nr:hypothetical protein COTS27_00156 [Spirochaetota bacterium]